MGFHAHGILFKYYRYVGTYVSSYIWFHDMHFEIYMGWVLSIPLNKIRNNKNEK